MTFGCVTTGELGQFLRLQGDEILSTEQRPHVGDLGAILAILRAIIASHPAT